MAELTQPTRQARARRRGVVALARAQLRRSGGGRVATVLGGLLVVGFAVAVLLLRAADGGDARLEGLVGTAARWTAWLVGAPIAGAAAEDRRSRNLRDGIDALAAARGFSVQSREAALVLGAMIEAASAIGVPLVALALLTAAVAGSLELAIARLGLALAAFSFAVVAGVTLGGLGATCGVLGRSRGRLLLVALVIGPWILADLTGYRALSIPGALAAALDFALGGAGA
jgi:hypothetical protein